jgi:class 3 adenylate cyclase/predicted ATPase
VTVVACLACGAENEPGRKFCGECGAALARLCAACGSPNPATVKFCGECGARLVTDRDEAGSATAVGESAHVAERRLVSVLFADIAGYTALSEGRDFEDVRELQSRYFDTARTVIERYGGTVEKFIGDAVMAVWGAPTAREDDAERAVRAAIDLVDAVDAMRDAVGVPELALRVGVLTGEAAVTVGAEGQGMVTGDLVNTASRVQGAAEPGTVLVGDATRRASEAAIAYADAGRHEMKGKSEPLQLWRALRVGALRDAERAGGLVAPFVGRAAELRLVKDLFHACADESRARLVSVIGVAGIGKSRLSLEFEKYLDGVALEVWWHRGRCLSYGDGVAFWALAEMVRSRARILEDEPAEAAGEKLRRMLEQHIDDERERAWIEPRLLHLLGLTDRTASDREDLFAAWRRFFERLAEQGPLVLVFEDLHWADDGLVAFVDYVLDWSRHHPIFVIALARPDIADRHPSFPGSTRSATTLPLEPLDDAAMGELLTGLVPELPPNVHARLLEAAGGIPLYAVETVRMLRDRGVLAGATEQFAELEVPETLHALIASRLDALPERERQLLQHGAVLGKTFTLRGLAALAGATEADLAPLVDDLVRKELLTVETDPFSPDRGQLAFLQALVQRVTYETIARRDRRGRHLAAAAYLASDAGMDPDEIAEVIAAHYLDAHEADPSAADADAVRAEARAWFTRAAERAASLAASLEAQRAFVRAADLSDDDLARGKALAQAGGLAIMGNRADEAESLLRDAIALLEPLDARAAADAQNRLGEILFMTERVDEAIRQLEGALVVYEAEGDDAAIATAAAQLGRFLLFVARQEDALLAVERALEIAERLELHTVIVQALINKSITLRGRPQESLALVRHALALAEETDDAFGALRACMNLGFLLAIGGREREALDVSRTGLAIARRVGDRVWERSLAANVIAGCLLLGEWDDAERVAAELPAEGAVAQDPVHANVSLGLARIAHERGDAERAVALAEPFASWGESARVQSEVTGRAARALAALAEGRPETAVDISVAALRDERIGSASPYAEEFLDLGGEACWRLRSPERLEEILELAAQPEARASFSAFTALQSARLAALRGDSDPGFGDAEQRFRELEYPYWTANAQLDHAEWLLGQGRSAEAAPLLSEARAVFERLRARPALGRIEGLESASRGSELITS